MIWKCEVVVIDKQNVKILVVGHNKEPTVNVITNNLGQMRKIVGTENIEVLKYNDILIVFDENAFRKQLPINRVLDGINIRGDFFIAGNDSKNNDFKDLSEEQIEKYTKEFSLEKQIEQEEEQLE